MPTTSFSPLTATGVGDVLDLPITKLESEGTVSLKVGISPQHTTAPLESKAQTWFVPPEIAVA
jgi:hypothetical protein